MSKGSSVALQQLIDDVQNNLQALKILNEPIDHWDTMIIHLVSTKLDAFVGREWEKHILNYSRRPTLKDMMDFLTKQRKYLERSMDQVNAIKSNPGNFSTSKVNKQGQQSRGTISATYVSTDTPVCPMCEASHYLYNCDEFMKLSVKDRISKVQQNQLCFNCLRGKHRNKDCGLGPCKKCPLKHNTLLHIEQVTQQKNRVDTTSMDESKTTASSTTMMTNDTQQRRPTVMLGTVRVNIWDSQNKIQSCRGLLDNCSQSHFITMRLCKLLGIPLIPIQHKVGGLETWSRVINYKAQVKIGSQHNGYKTTITCLVVSTISEDMPNVNIDAEAFRIPANVTMADPDFNKSRGIDLLIGGEIFWDLLCVGQIRLTPTPSTTTKN